MLESILGLSPAQRQQIEKDIGPIRSVTDFCSDFLEASKECPVNETLSRLLPWATKGTHLLGEITPLARVLVKLVDAATKQQDPEILGILACSLAYQHSAAMALAQQGEPRNHVPFESSALSVKKALEKLMIQVDLLGFSLEAPLAHPFVWQADESLYFVVRNVGYSDDEWRRIQARIHDQFRADLVEVLSNGETATRFEPFTKRLLLGDKSAAYAALNAHIERLRWVFEDRPVLNVEPFTLSDVYVDTDCGRLLWKDFREADNSARIASGIKFDPFSWHFGGRYPLLETVLEYIRDPKFNDAIVIQGAPGSGKSSFTLRLADVLRREGLRPLRIRLKFLDLKRSLLEALAKVVLQPEEGEDPALSKLPLCSDPFSHESIFQERTKFGAAEICPYVLILDGWDEISVSVNEGFEIEVQRMLENVRREFLGPRAVKVRVILTGRPSHAIERSQFLRDESPVLTIRDYNADQLELFASKVKAALHRARLRNVTPSQWAHLNSTNVDDVISSFRDDPGTFDILGLPLLAHLSLRLLAMSEEEGKKLLADRTTLYRHLLDETCPKAGKASSDSDDLHMQARVRGTELRRMLQRTAIAITVYGNESIPYRELDLRLRASGIQVMKVAESAGKDHPLTRLMIAFYFKGGRENLGCEFLHKSFREYLYAEAVVEALKEYGRRSVGILAKREPYWRDFEESDPRKQFSRDLCHIICARPLAAEIGTHIRGLLSWEIGRSSGKENPNNHGKSLDSVKFEQWITVRDGLADLWDWWGEGVHLRAQPYRDKSDNLHYHPAFVNDLLDESLPRDRGRDAPEWWPGRLVNADANVGDTLCQLNVWVHYWITGVIGWDCFLQCTSEQGDTSRCSYAHALSHARAGRPKTNPGEVQTRGREHFAVGIHLPLAGLTLLFSRL